MSLLGSNAAAGAVSMLRGFPVATSTMFCALFLATPMIFSGCASQHNSPPPAVTATPTQDVSSSGLAAPGADVEARRMAAAAKRLNLEVVKKDSQVVYCRSNVVTGSPFQKDRHCYTAEQVESMQQQAQRSSGK